MIRKGSLVLVIGNVRGIAPGKLLSVHDAKDGKVIVWVPNDNGGYNKRTLKADDVELIVE